MRKLLQISKKKHINRNRRINLVFMGFILLFLLISAKLIRIQLIDTDKYRLAAKKQYQTKVMLSPARGLVYDRNMNVLVSNSVRISIAADPNMIPNVDSVATILAKVFNKDKSEYIEKIINCNSSFLYLEKKLEPSDLKGIDSLEIPGLIFLKEPKRVYNYGSLASQILGFTDQDNAGKTGLELSCEKQLSGEEGYVIMQKDGKGNKRPDNKFQRKEPVQGSNLVLTIDVNAQKFVEEELEAGVKQFNAVKGRVIMLSVKTGEIIAMGSYPSFDPNQIKTEDTIGMKNTVLSDIFEPGSTFKIITAAGILEENIEVQNSIINTEDGTYDIHGMKIKDSHGANAMTFRQIIEQSSNIGVIKIVRKLGQERFYKYARDFGFGVYSGLELPGENKGYLKRPIDFSSESLEYMSIGYQIMVNSLQLSMAYSAVANKGVLLKPYIVKKEIGTDGRILSENHPVKVRQVISEKTAFELTSFFKGVVDNGTGTDAKIDGISIAGKTGTSQRLIDNKYSSESHTASFIGYFPAENPVVLIAVILDDPKSGDYYGGKVAAPIFKKIAQRMLNFNGYTDLSNQNHRNESENPEKNKDGNFTPAINNFIYVPNLANMKIENAIDILKERNLKYEIINAKEYTGNKSGNDLIIVESQSPLSEEKNRQKF